MRRRVDAMLYVHCLLASMLRGAGVRRPTSDVLADQWKASRRAHRR